MNKYRNKSCVIDGHRFASLAEGRRYGELKLLLKAGMIARMVLQPRYNIEIEGVFVCR